MRFAPLSGLALAAVASIAACTSVVEIDDDDDGSVCGPKPPSGGWCPPVWSCVDGEWVSSAGACPDPACPATEPSTGDSCPKVTQECSYTIEQPCGPVTEQVYECTTTGWQTIYPACQPEPTCPDEMPVVGSDCSGWDYPYFCQYGVSCSAEPSFVTMSCDYSDPPVWKLDSAPQDCACGMVTDAALCSATAGCRWLVPGCGEGPQVLEGCYPALDCQFEACPPPEGCFVFGHDPCWSSPCDACGAQTGICLPPTD